MATVIGPTPPGTGLTAEATAATSSKATSPTVLRVPSGASTREMPTSITTAPGLTMSAVISPGVPAAEMSTSAVRVSEPSCGVYLLVEITVAWSRMSSTTTGLPTMLLAPTQTHWVPGRSMPVDSIISMTASAVHGTRLRRPYTMLPMFAGLTPSTSFTGSIIDWIRSVSTPDGSGRCTMTACTSGSALSSMTRPAISSSRASSGSWCRTCSIPSSRHAVPWLRA